MFTNVHTVLVLAPHTDDGEFGAGGAIARMVEMGCDVHYVAFSDCVDSLPEGWPADTLVKELRAATTLLGLPAANVQALSFPVRRFSHVRQEILETLVRLQKDLDPDLVLLPSENDLHQDHHVIAKEGLRAFKRTTVLAYEIPWNNLQFQNELFVHLQERHVATKVSALACYQSQAQRHYANEEFVRAQAMMRGCQAGVRYAEVFEVIRAIVK